MRLRKYTNPQDGWPATGWLNLNDFVKDDPTAEEAAAWKKSPERLDYLCDRIAVYIREFRFLQSFNPDDPGGLVTENGEWRYDPEEYPDEYEGDYPTAIMDNSDPPQTQEELQALLQQRGRKIIRFMQEVMEHDLYSNLSESVRGQITNAYMYLKAGVDDDD